MSLFTLTSKFSAVDMTICPPCQVAELQMNLETLETERDFYFAKLRDIELICQENEDQPTIGSILDIMYATQVSHVMSCDHYFTCGFHAITASCVTVM